MRTTVLLCALPAFLFAACVSEPPPTVDSRTPIEECPHGLYWSECGGSGDAVLACDRETCDCRWFEGGVTARGYAVSDCPTADPCCHDGWPFTDFAPEGSVLAACREQLPLLEASVVSRRDTNEVAVSPDLEGETYPGTIRCVSGIFNGCGVAGGSLSWEGDALVQEAGSSLHRFRLEILPGPSSLLDWRVRLYRITSLHFDGPVFLSCYNYAASEEIPLVGVLRVNTDRLDDLTAFHGRLEATTTNGVQFTVDI